MKKYRIPIVVLTVLPLVVMLLLAPHLPESVPIHYDMRGEADRWGGKWELLLFPAINVIFAITMAQLSHKIPGTKEAKKSNDRVFGLATVLVLLLFDVMAGYFLWTAMIQAGSLAELSVDIYQVMMGCAGVMITILGNVMPKTRINSIIGMRTGFSMKNEDAWKLSQRIGGAGLMITGVTILLIALLTRGVLCMLLGIAALAIGMTATVLIAGAKVKRMA